MQPPLSDRIIGVVGQSGFGKSTKLRELVEQRERVIILEQTDLKSEYPDTIRYRTYADMRRELLEARPRRFRVALAPGREFFPHTLALAWVLADPEITVVVEEAGRYFNKGEKPPREVIEIADRGRHAGPRAVGRVSLLLCSQRPVVIPKDLRAQLNRVYAFRLADKDDRDWLAGVPGCQRATAEAVRDLPRFNYFNINTEGETTREQTHA